MEEWLLDLCGPRKTKITNLFQHIPQVPPLPAPDNWGGGERTRRIAFSIAGNLTHLGLKSKYTPTWVTESAGKFSNQVRAGGGRGVGTGAQRIDSQVFVKIKISHHDSTLQCWLCNQESKIKRRVVGWHLKEKCSSCSG